VKRDYLRFPKGPSGEKIKVTEHRWDYNIYTCAGVLVEGKALKTRELARAAAKMYMEKYPCIVCKRCGLQTGEEEDVFYLS